ncbi:hypothetical protein OMK64_03460 [Cellulomonas fimi]|uniref:hypothetical protein n=1 Tax=Cellulomonas fimi TaxID=1708 RepID=UPI00234CCEB3|nr:hypothetical protein [Cellulomonas fimi]MDC7120588.1 hypothetical protein [Cellulomonas fimi]
MNRDDGRGDLFYPPLQMNQPTALPVPIVWSAHAPEDQELLLEELDLWIGWLVERFQLDRRVVPACWHDHTELIEELSALHLAWQGAYATTANADAPLRWLEQFAAARTRLSDCVARSGCRPAEHRTRG